MEKSPINKQEYLCPAGLVETLDLYSGNSDRMLGLKYAKEAIDSHVVSDTINIKVIAPIIFSPKIYEHYEKSGSSEVLIKPAEEAWKLLYGPNAPWTIQLDGQSAQRPAIIRSNISDKNGKTIGGPRSGIVDSIGALMRGLSEVYEYAKTNLSNLSEFSIGAYIHKAVNVANPPLQRSPFVPYPAGTIIPLTNDTLEAYAIFGSPESTHSFPCDKTRIKLDSDGPKIFNTEIVRKTKAIIPAIDGHEEISIPENFQTIAAFDQTEIYPLAKIANAIREKHGPHSLEFCKTIINGRSCMVIIEASIFNKYVSSYKNLQQFGDRFTRPVNIITNASDIKKLQLSKNNVSVIYLAPQMFRRDGNRESLNDLLNVADDLKNRLIIIPSGNLSSQHIFRNYVDHGHVLVDNVGDQKFRRSEEIEIYKDVKGNCDWRRKDNVVRQSEIADRSVSEIGTKAWNIQRLVDNKIITTSPYFVIRTSVYEGILNELGLKKYLQTLDTLSFKDEIKIAEITRLIRTQVLNYRGNKFLCLGENYLKLVSFLLWSCSSSTIEDGKKMSYAGIFDSEEDVKSWEMRRAILKVFASQVSAKAVKKMLTIGDKPSEASMAVMVQKMVDCFAAGTIFTKDHANNDVNILTIIVRKGFGGRIVDGTARDAQRIIFDKRTGKVHYIPDNPKILGENEEQGLIECGLKIEAFQNSPRDIEWTIDKNHHRISVVQDRPL